MGREDHILMFMDAIMEAWGKYGAGKSFRMVVSELRVFEGDDMFHYQDSTFLKKFINFVSSPDLMAHVLDDPVEGGMVSLPELKDLWLEHREYRFGQLVYNYVEDFYLDRDEIL